MKIEYKVRPVTRYVVTCYIEDGKYSSCVTQGEYDNADLAYEVGYALAKEQMRLLELPPGDTTVTFPERINQGVQIGGISSASIGLGSAKATTSQTEPICPVAGNE